MTVAEVDEVPFIEVVINLDVELTDIFLARRCIQEIPCQCWSLWLRIVGCWLLRHVIHTAGGDNLSRKGKLSPGLGIIGERLKNRL